MKKGDEITLVMVGEECRPGKRARVLVQDVKEDVLTVSRTDPLPCTSAFVMETLEPYFVKQFLGACKHKDGYISPAIMQLRRDEIMDQFFSPKVLSPHLNKKNLRFEYGLPTEVLNMWITEGLLTKEMTDWYYGCPECDSPMVVRKGCRSCKSARLSRDQLIRHDTCGYIDLTNNFQKWTCPCCQEKLVDGRYSTLHSPAKCQDCFFVNDTHPYFVASCLGCRGVFSLEDAMEVPIFSYYRRQRDKA